LAQAAEAYEKAIESLEKIEVLKKHE